MTPFFLLAGSSLAAAVHAMTLKVSGQDSIARHTKGATGTQGADGHAPARLPARRGPLTLPNPSTTSMDKRHD